MRRSGRRAAERPEICVGGDDGGFDFGTVGRRRRRKDAKFGGFNSGMSGKARRHVSAAVLSNTVRRQRGGSGSGRAARHGAALSEIEALRLRVRQAQEAATLAAARAKSGAGSGVGAGAGGKPTPASEHERQTWAFRSLLRSVLGPVVSRDSRGSVRRRQFGAPATTAHRSNTGDVSSGSPGKVPQLATMCLDVIIKYVDCVEDPRVFQSFTGEQQERLMREAGGIHGLELDSFRGMCSPLVHDAIVRGPQGNDEFVDALLPRVVGVSVDVEALAAQLSSDSDSDSDSDSGSDSDGAGFSFAPRGWMPSAMRTVHGCRRLQSLCLFQAKAVTAAALERVAARLPSLERISIHESLEGEMGPARVLEALASMSNLRFVSISQCRWLHLSATTDLAPLLGLKHLRRLVLHKVTTDNIEEQASFAFTVKKSMFSRRVEVDLTFKVKPTK